MSANPDSNELPPAHAGWALFLDFDGTLVELREHPSHVVVSPGLTELLESLSAAFQGAVAVVSGRSIADLDRLLAPLRLPLAGVHGLERRDAAGRMHCDEEAERTLAEVREAVADFVELHEGLHWEDKGSAFAVHYRRVPEFAGAVREFLQEQRDLLDGDFHVQAGKSVFELKPSGRNKGNAVHAFMSEAPFSGRVPVFIGDDVTDEDAFRAVNALGGCSIRIGPAETTGAGYQLDSVESAVAWLAGVAGTLRDQDARPGSSG